MASSNDNNTDSLGKLYEQLLELCLRPAINSPNSLLLLLWGYFYIAIDKEEEGTGTTTTALTLKNIIPVDQGYPIFDYGYYLKTSAGKDYGSYTTGRLLTTVKAMVALSSERRAKRVSFSGSPAAERVAYIECNKYKLANYFNPDVKTISLEERLRSLDKYYPAAG